MCFLSESRAVNARLFLFRVCKTNFAFVDFSSIFATMTTSIKIKTVLLNKVRKIAKTRGQSITGFMEVAAQKEITEYEQSQKKSK